MFCHTIFYFFAEISVADVIWGAVKKFFGNVKNDVFLFQNNLFYHIARKSVRTYFTVQTDIREIAFLSLFLASSKIKLAT